MKIKGLIAIVITLWGMMFSLPLVYGEATFKKSAFSFAEREKLVLEKFVCGYKFKIPDTFDECNGFKSIKVPRPNKYVPYSTSDRSYKVQPFIFNCYDFSGTSASLSITDVHGKTLMMRGSRIIKDER